MDNGIREGKGKAYAVDKVKMQEKRDELKRDLNEVDRKVDADWKKFKETVSVAIDSLKAVICK